MVIRGVERMRKKVPDAVKEELEEGAVVSGKMLARILLNARIAGKRK